ncbi:MAG TPA: SDR family oxidoreductase [Amnibacterium sp.]|nr:SDR family oxidoreductase [Amnibacterium sp.]
MPDVFSPTALADARILVTGGGSGLGRAIAQRLAAHGAEVHVWGRRPGVLEETVAAVEAAGGRAFAQAVDVRDPAAVDAGMAHLFDTCGPLTGVVNGAAANFVARTEHLSPRAFEAVTSTVMNGSYFVTTAAGRRWIAQGLPGSVVSLLTSWIWTGSAFTVPSAMAKAAVHAMTMSLAVEWAAHGIRINAVAPGPVPTEFAWDVLDPGEAGGNRVPVATEADGVPAGRHGTAEEVADVVLFLLSGAAPYLTGDAIAVDGGQRLAGPGTFAGLRALSPDDWTALRERARRAGQARDAASAASRNAATERGSA